MDEYTYWSLSYPPGWRTFKRSRRTGQGPRFIYEGLVCGQYLVSDNDVDDGSRWGRIGLEYIAFKTEQEARSFIEQKTIVTFADCRRKKDMYDVAKSP